MCDDNEKKLPFECELVADDVGDTVLQLRREIADLRDKNRYLSEALHRDATGMAHALGSVRIVVRGSSWLAVPETWSCYEQAERTEETLRREIGSCLNEIDAIAKAALTRSGDLVDATTRGEPLPYVRKVSGAVHRCKDCSQFVHGAGPWGQCKLIVGEVSLNGSLFCCGGFDALKEAQTGERKEVMPMDTRMLEYAQMRARIGDRDDPDVQVCVAFVAEHERQLRHQCGRCKHFSQLQHFCCERNTETYADESCSRFEDKGANWQTG